VPTYAIQSRARKVDGHAVPSLTATAAAAVRIDGQLGFAYPALELAVGALPELAKLNGIAIAVICRSHHFGQAGLHVERLAQRGLIGLLLGNTPKAMAFHGGRRARLGTNPLAFACPLPDGHAAPLVIDLAMSVAARAKIVAAEKAGKPIPADWAYDEHGRPTSDAAAALAGSLAPIGGAKGAALALMIEILAAGLSGGAFGWESSSMFDDRGGPPNLGHVMIAIDPLRVGAEHYMARMSALLAALAEESGPRLPGARRLESRARAARDGLQIPAALHEQILALIRDPI
jgi:(2R)-3-sulfolactate dehydrogenase (NADP+)